MGAKDIYLRGKYLLGFFYAEDLTSLQHWDRLTRKIAKDECDSGYGYYPFFEHMGEVCQLLSLGIIGRGVFFCQLTKGHKPIRKGMVNSEGFRLDDDSYCAVSDSGENVYVSQMPNAIKKIRTAYEHRTIKSIESGMVAERTSPAVLFSVGGVVFDHTPNEVYSTKENKRILQTDSKILSIGGIEGLLCSCEDGNIIEAASGRTVYSNNKPCMLFSLEGSMVKVLPISGGWLFDDVHPDGYHPRSLTTP